MVVLKDKDINKGTMTMLVKNIRTKGKTVKYSIWRTTDRNDNRSIADESIRNLDGNLRKKKRVIQKKDNE